MGGLRTSPAPPMQRQWVELRSSGWWKQNVYVREVGDDSRKVGRGQPLGTSGVKLQNLNSGRNLWGIIEEFWNRIVPIYLSLLRYVFRLWPHLELVIIAWQIRKWTITSICRVRESLDYLWGCDQQGFQGVTGSLFSWGLVKGLEQKDSTLREGSCVPEGGCWFKFMCVEFQLGPWHWSSVLLDLK